MSNGRHSYVAFYPSDWLGGTARLPRLHRSVYFDVCCYNWDLAAPCPAIELSVMVSDLKGGMKIVDELVAMGKLIRNDDGSIENPKAIAEARKALAAWEAMSKGGKARGKPDAKGDGKGVPKGLDNPHGMGEPIEPELKIVAKATSAGAGEDGFEIVSLTSEIARTAGVFIPDDGKARQEQLIVRAWLSAGATAEQIRTVVASSAGGKSIGTLKYFDSRVRETIAGASRPNTHADALIQQAQRYRKAAA